MPDGSVTEGGTPPEPTNRKAEHPALFSPTETAAVEKKAAELVGQSSTDRFKDTDGNIITVSTSEAFSFHGHRPKGSLLPRRHDLLVEVKDKTDTRHPDDPTRTITPYEQVFIDTDRKRSAVLVARGYYENGKQTVTDNDVRETREQRQERIKKLQELLSHLTPDDLINQFERTVKEAAEDSELAETVRKQIDRLLQTARDNDGLQGNPVKDRHAQFQEPDAGVANVTIGRSPEIGDNVIILDTAVTPKLPDESAEIPLLQYHIRETGYGDQRIVIQSTIQHIAPDGTRLPPDEGSPLLGRPSKDDFATPQEINGLAERLERLDAHDLRTPPKPQG